MSPDPASLDGDDDPKKKRPRALGARIILVAALLVATAVAWIYPRYFVTKQGLGGPCTWAMHCKPEAPRCLRESEDSGGVCSRLCEPGQDCADGIRCVKVELDERDDRGVPLQGGYCVPQAMIDARKAHSKR